MKAFAILWQKLHARFSEHIFDLGIECWFPTKRAHLDIRTVAQCAIRICPLVNKRETPGSRIKGNPVNLKSSEPIAARRSKEPNRRQFIGGSDARIIMSPDEAALIRLWQEKRGEAEPADLSDDLIVQLGVTTETLNRRWYERNTGRSVTDVQRWVQHPVHRYLAATLDGFVNAVDAVFEAKFMLPWSFSEEAAIEKHMAQLQHNMWVTNARSAALSIITGGGKWVQVTIPADALYQHFLVTAERRFWRCVQTGATPRPYGIEPPRPRVEAVRVVDMSGTNSWAEFAGLFCATRSSFLDHERAKAELKALMPEDAKEATGHGVRAKRSKSGAVSFDLLTTEENRAAL
ncbi:MAG: YqaJ viral recombinase family protein [Hyphomicrobiales bacterium]|nr:YqaJ viral recombinase family protein [Hyphomicrobiales bacterium]